MPAKYKREDCPHEIVLPKLFTVTPQERVSANKAGYKVPDRVALEWCIGCWTINPPQITHDSTTLQPEKSQP